MKVIRLILLMAMALCMSGCLEAGNPPNTTVDLSNGSFVPSSITVPAGTTITWANHNGTSVKIVGSGGSFSSNDIPDGYEFRYTFLVPGTYEYHLEDNPSINGEVVVTSKSGSPAQEGNTSSGNASGNAAPVNASSITSGAPSKSITIGLVAKNIAFNASTITVPAGARVTINFDNQDPSVPHNFAVYETSSAQNAIFKGKIITGPSTTTYTFTAPSKPGTYYFQCDVHPSLMNGQFIVQ